MDKALDPKVVNVGQKCIDTVLQMFRYGLYIDFSGDIENLKVISPIEQIYYFALRSFLYLMFKKIEPELIVLNEGKKDRISVDICPQKQFDNYFVDFYLERVELGNKKLSVVVECDSQQWHETTEKQRRYEKKRDRYFAKKNIKVLHFTGKEIIENPFVAVKETLETLFGNEPVLMNMFDSVCSEFCGE